MLAASEHQMFEQMRKARFAGFLVLRANVIPDVYRDNRRLVIFMYYDPQAIVQDKLFAGDFEVGKAHYGVKSSQ